MSAPESVNNLATYLINNGSYNSANINFDLHLPKPTGFSYVFSPDAHNISKNIGGSLGTVNAICFFMKKSTGNGTPLNTIAETKTTLTFDLGNLIQHLGAIPFDSSKTNTFVIVIHNDDFDSKLVALCYDNLGDYIDNVRIDNSPKIIDVAFVPRKLGVSIIRR